MYKFSRCRVFNIDGSGRSISSLVIDCPTKCETLAEVLAEKKKIAARCRVKKAERTEVYLIDLTEI